MDTFISNRREDRTAASPEQPVKTPSRVTGLLAICLSGTTATTMLLLVIFERTGHGRTDLADRLSRMIFDYSFVLDVVAALAAFLAISAGGSNRRLGLAAVALIALSFGLLFFG